MHPAVDTDVTLAGPLVVTAIDTFAEMMGSAYTGTVVVQDPSAPDPRNSGVSTITFTFDEAVTAFDLSDITLTRDGGENLLTGSRGLQLHPGLQVDRMDTPATPGAPYSWA